MNFYKNNYLYRLVLFLLIFNYATSGVLAEEIILINQPLSANDKRYEYPQELLTKALEITKDHYGPARVEHSKYEMYRTRTLIELVKGEKIHVMAEAVKPKWEEKLLPIRIPIRKGIQGFRTFLIRKENQAKLSEIKTLDRLKKIPTGSGTQWSTTRVLKENGFNVVTHLDYESLFRLLMRGKFITFGRGINETSVEYALRKEQFPDLAIEKDLLLYIPLPTYFYVTPTKSKLAERIEKGLLKMIDDGTFDEIFYRYFETRVKDSNLSKRRMFKINNPNLSKETPLDVEKFWYKP